MFTIVSFYTPRYGASAARLVQSCTTLNLNFHIEAVPSLGSWRRNCDFKAVFIRRKLMELGHPVAWVDADAVIHEYPALFDALEDGAWADAGLYFQTTITSAADAKDRPSIGIASGTMWWSPSQRAIALLDRWISMSSECASFKYEQAVLTRAYGEMADQLHIHPLPQSYIKIFDRPWRKGHKGPAVIEHFQASRTLRRLPC